MNEITKITVDANEAVARIAHKTNEVIAIYPITPASPMGEHSDAWSAEGIRNIWGSVPHIVEMQSEGGAAGAIHGSLQAGSLTTTFTASQGLLLMIPNMYKIAGELSPTVFHVAARSIAAQALSIFADHSDVMATRATGFALLASNSVQEAQDMALIAQASSLEGRIPVLHFFDGFRTSHEISKIVSLDDSAISALLPLKDSASNRARAMSPEHPNIRGTSQNPDVFFQARETVNPYYKNFPKIVSQKMAQFEKLTGRSYKIFEYIGAHDAERIIIIMGSGAETVHETVKHLEQQGGKVGVLKVRLYRPFYSTQFIQTLPKSVKSIAVLDRTKEPGSEGEPLYKDVCTALFEHSLSPKVIGGRYGLGSKEFTPGMVKAVFDELPYSESGKNTPKNGFTIGIDDDLTHTSLAWDEHFKTDANARSIQCVFFGLGSDGTVSANKSSIKIIGENTLLFAQGYFVYDSKKSGAVTISHLRFGPAPIKSSYLIGHNSAQYVGCHQTLFLDKYDVLDYADSGAVFLLNTSIPLNNIWNTLPEKVKQQIIEKNIQFYAIDAYKIAEESGMGRRINTVMQTCFFAISNVLPRDKAIKSIKKSVEKTYGKKGRHIIRTNFQAIENTLQGLHKIKCPDQLTDAGAIKEEDKTNHSLITDDTFISNVTKKIIANEGNLIPVSLLPENGTYPSGTAKYEKRNLALELPLWDESLCTHCGKCVFVCPHSVIRSKAFTADAVVNAPESFKHIQIKGKDYPDNVHISYQISPEDCTGCTLCVDICPIRDKTQANRKAINMVPQQQIKAKEIVNWEYFLSLPDWNLKESKSNTMKGAMLHPPYFEFSGACSGCGETPYIRLATQLFGDRMLVANATGCSSIYGGNLPTTPWTTDKDNRGPSWNNSLFEDNAEFGLGMRIACDQQRQMALDLLKSLNANLPEALVESITNPDESDEAGIYEQRQRIKALKQHLLNIDSKGAKQLNTITDALSKRSIWIIGGDGWAYDIGFGGLDHVLSTGKDVNILVLDTEVYSNTGGQTSKATPKGAVAKFSAAGKPTTKKDLARMAMTYEHVYVAHVAYGAKDIQTLHTFIEAESYPGPSLIIAYAPCIAHGVDLVNNHRQQNMAVDSGHWPLLRYDPRKLDEGKNPLRLDSKKPSLDYVDFIKSEARFSMLWHSAPERADLLLKQAQSEVLERYEQYQQLAALKTFDKGEESNND